MSVVRTTKYLLKAKGNQNWQEGVFGIEVSSIHTDQFALPMRHAKRFAGPQRQQHQRFLKRIYDPL